MGSSANRPHVRLLTLFVGVGVLLGACARQQPVAPLTIVEARATSQTSVIVTYSAAVDDQAVNATNYAVSGPGGTTLGIVGAYRTIDPTKVALATEPQQLIQYQLAVRDVGVVDVAATPAGEIQSGFTGSSETAPYVADAIALTNTTILVSYGDAGGRPPEMGPGTLTPANYLISGDALSVLGVSYASGGTDKSRVILTTTPMDGHGYEVGVSNVFSMEGERLLDPFLAAARFPGMAVPDTAAPTVRDVYADGNEAVVVHFSEPVSGGAADPTNYVIEDPDGNVVPVEAATLGDYGIAVTLATWPMTPGVDYTLAAVTGVVDTSGNALTINAAGPPSFTGAPADTGEDNLPPRVLGANSLSNSEVVVTFSEPIYGGEDPRKYSIADRASYGSSNLHPQAVLLVESATVSASRRSVTLTTRSQTELLYALTVTDVTDAAGNQVVPPDRDHPFQVTFMGTGYTGTADDSDGDGLSDAAEQAGWTVTVLRTDGTSESRKVTSDPDAPDTDDDGIVDSEERYYLTDPRSSDSDSDGLTDYEELVDYYSEPTVMDTDGDGLNDGLEVSLFGTSPLLEDTDGDQLSDDYEIGADNRNPRIADLPMVDIRVGTVDLRLDVRFEESTSTGTREVDSREAAVTLAQSQESAQSSETSTTLDWFIQGGAEVCFKGSCEDHATAGAKFTVEGGASGGTTTTFTNASVRSAQREYATTLASEAEVSAEATLNRVVEAASIAVELSLANASNIAFTISDIEVTALIQDPSEPSRLIPVATLFSASNAPISIGPLTPERGPFRFASDDAYPALVENLMANPRGVVFRVANYDITDEFGRNFAFVEQDVNDRTAFLAVDYAGNLDPENYLVATNSTFTDAGLPAGITMKELLEDVLGLEHIEQDEDEKLDPNVAADADRLDASYSTRVIDGITALHRIKRVSAELTGSDRVWWVLGPQGNITPIESRPGKDFLSYSVFADQDYAFAFVQDLDEDDLEAKEELLYRSIDSDLDGDNDGVADSRDTDDDGIDDGDEVYGPYQGNRRIRWVIGLDDGRDSYTTMSHPGREDSDGDGLLDCQELLVSAACSAITVYLDAAGVPTLEPTSNTGTAHAELGTTTLTRPTDPSDPDTDGDGIPDAVEVAGFAYVGLDGTDKTLTYQTVVGTPYATNPLSRDTDRDGLDDRAEAVLGSNPVVPDGDTVRDNDADGLVNAVETTNQAISVVTGTGPGAASVTVLVTSDPDSPDTDGDGLTDWEEYNGCLDQNRDFVCDSEERFGPTDRDDADTDDDGLSDRRELLGVTFPVDASNPLRYTDPVDADTDNDQSSDGQETNQSWVVTVAGSGGYVVWSDPTAADRDGDSLSDSVERSNGSDPNESDTDGDGALDGLETSRGTSPLVADHLVTVTFKQLELVGGHADYDGDEGLNAGDFAFSFGVRTPPNLGFIGLVGSGSYVGVLPDCTGLEQSYCSGTVNGTRVVQLQSPLDIDLDGYSGNGVVIDAQITFALPFTRLFVLEGWLQELDEGGADFNFDFGGIGDPSADFSGADLQKGSFSVRFTGEPENGRAFIVTAVVTVE